MLNPLYHRRQFLLTNKLIEELEGWQYRKVGDAHLHAHPDLEITEKEESSASIILLGYIFDPFKPAKSNTDIISDIISNAENFNSLIAAIKTYAGRYALIYRSESDFTILSDPLGLREIYYSTEQNKVICGSQPNFLDAYSEPKLGITLNKELLHFYDHDMKFVRNRRLWVGDETYYNGVKHLMPNHFLDIRSLTVKRYWPNIRLERMDLGTAVKQSCEYLKGVMEAVTSRFDVMLAVTSGTDSRSLMAASKQIKDRVYYFINKHPSLNEESGDIRVPVNMFKTLNIPFHVHTDEGPIDDGFKKIFLDNTFLSNDFILPTIYNVYYKEHPEKVNLLGVGEIGRDYFGPAPENLNGYYLARCLKYHNSPYATEQCGKWLKEARIIAEENNIDIMQLFLWEGLLANWGAVGNSESDIAIEEFDPYDSHYIYEILLSVYNDYRKSELFDEMFREMWPELLDFPFNPPDTLRDRIKDWLQAMGLFYPLRRQKYKLDFWKYRKLGKRSHN